jgi:hypothetical protein
MRWSQQFTDSARQLGRLFLSWRMARLLCAVWFALTSIGLPGSLSQLGGANCARNPGSQCRCSLTKRVSGTCCCVREAQAESTKSCCTVKKPTPKRAEPVTSVCHSSKAPKAELRISSCDCPSESPEGVSLNSEPRLSATLSVVSLPETTVTFVTLPAERVESALLLPPVPPPKVVL